MKSPPNPPPIRASWGDAEIALPHRAIVWLAATLVLIAMVAGACYWIFREMEVSAHASQRTQLVLNKTRDLLSSLTDPGEDKRLMDAIRTEVGAFIRDETQHQAVLDEKFNKTIGWLLVSIAAAGAIAVLFALACGYLIYRASRQRPEDSVDVEKRHLLEVQKQTIEQLQLANSALQISEERACVTLNSMGDGVIATDAQGRVTVLNAQAQSLTGWTLVEARGQRVAEVFNLVNHQTRLPVTVPVIEALASGRVQALASHTVLISRLGVECDIADSCAPIRDRDDAVIGAVLVFRDVTQEYTVRQPAIASDGMPLNIAPQESGTPPLITPFIASMAPLVPALDVRVLEELIGNDREVLHQFIADFGASAAVVAKDLQAAYAAGQTMAVGNLAHKLKSSARAVGALYLGDQCAAIEMAGKLHDVQILKVLLPDFEKEMDRVSRFIQSSESECVG